MRWKQIALDEIDSFREIVPARVLLGDFQRGARDVCGDNFGIVDVFGDGNCNAARAGTNICDGAAFGRSFEPFDGALD